MPADAVLNIWHIATLNRWHLQRLRLRALREEAALLPRYKLQASGPWNTNQVVHRCKCVMAANDCEARGKTGAALSGALPASSQGEGWGKVCAGRCR